MIALLIQVIREHPEWLRFSHSSLSFMKASTPTSGTSLDRGKVILFVFEVGQTTPTLCVKTIRTHSAGDVIRRNYANLKLLEEGVRGSEYAQMFAKPLHLYDDGNLIFCIESVCPGVIFSAQTRGLKLVAERYGAWQSHLAHTAKEILHVRDLENLAHDTINTLGLTETATSVLRDYFQKLPLALDIRLPVLVQHGDMTPDNVLVSGDNIHLIDYDHVGLSQLAGFDLFHFLSKLKSHSGSFRADCTRYFSSYFQSIGASTQSSDAILFTYYLQECRRKRHEVKSKSGEEIVADFMTITNR